MQDSFHHWTSECSHPDLVRSRYSFLASFSALDVPRPLRAFCIGPDVFVPSPALVPRPLFSDVCARYRIFLSHLRSFYRVVEALWDERACQVSTSVPRHAPDVQ